MNSSDWGSWNFRVQAFSTAISTIGMNAGPIAFAFAVLQSGGSASDVGFVTAARTAPMIVFLLHAGVLGDRLSRRTIMIAANLLSAVSFISFGLAIQQGWHSLTLLCALSFAAGTATALYYPAAEAANLQIVDPAKPERSLATLRLIQNSGQVLGASVGGGVVALSGPALGLVLCGVVFVPAALLRMGLRLPPVGDAAERENIWLNLCTGWREFTRSRWLWAMVLQMSLVNAMVVGFMGVLGPLYANSTSWGAPGWGLVLTSQTVGFIVGGLTMTRIRPRKPLLFGIAASMLFALLPLTLVFGLPLPLAAAASLASGLGDEMYGVCWLSTLRQEIPEERMSRVASYDMFCSVALTPLGGVAAGPLTQHFGLLPTLVAISAFIILSTIIVMLLRDVRSMSRRAAATTA